MAGNKNPEKTSESHDGSSWVHAPLPYIVRLLVVIDEDRPPQSYEVRTSAYSVMEAFWQAMMILSGKADASSASYKIESIEPDLPQYYALMFRKLAEAADVAASR